MIAHPTTLTNTTLGSLYRRRQCVSNYYERFPGDFRSEFLPQDSIPDYLWHLVSDRTGDDVRQRDNAIDGARQWTYSADTISEFESFPESFYKFVEKLATTLKRSTVSQSDPAQAHWPQKVILELSGLRSKKRLDHDAKGQPAVGEAADVEADILSRIFLIQCHPGLTPQKFSESQSESPLSLVERLCSYRRDEQRIHVDIEMRSNNSERTEEFNQRIWLYTLRMVEDIVKRHAQYIIEKTIIASSLKPAQPPHNAAPQPIALPSYDGKRFAYVGYRDPYRPVQKILGEKLISWGYESYSEEWKVTSDIWHGDYAARNFKGRLPAYDERDGEAFAINESRRVVTGNPDM